MGNEELTTYAQAVNAWQLERLRQATRAERDRPRFARTGKVVGIENGVARVRDELGRTQYGTQTAGRLAEGQVVAIVAEGRFDPI